MKGIIIICSTVIIVLVAGLGSMFFLNNSASDLADKLQITLDAVNQEDWQEAKTTLQDCLNSWQDLQPRWNALINHKEVDDIQMTLVRAQQYVANEEKASALAELAAAKELIKHVPKKESPAWHNIL